MKRIINLFLQCWCIRKSVQKWCRYNWTHKKGELLWNSALLRPLEIHGKIIKYDFLFS